MTSFKKTNVKIYTKKGTSVTPDNLYWKKLGVSMLSCYTIELSTLYICAYTVNCIYIFFHFINN